ncbi:MAG: hypothetical protein ACKVJG_07410 [Candidatus Latescibacterota bacterium]
MIDHYQEQVYAAVLGKVIGVYVGRPFEQWKKAECPTAYSRLLRGRSARRDRLPVGRR